MDHARGLAERGGPSLRDVLAAKEHVTLFRTNLRDYLIFEAGHVLRRPRRVNELMQDAWQSDRRAAEETAA